MDQFKTQLQRERSKVDQADKQEAIVQLEKLRWPAGAVELGIRDDFKCQYCGRDLLASVDDYDAWQFDHLIPTSKGGNDDEANMVVSCKTCNFIKRNYDPTEGGANDRESQFRNATEYVRAKRAEKLAALNEIRNVLLRTGIVQAERFGPSR